MSALVIADHDNACLKASTLHAVTAATQCGGEVHILVAGHNAGPVAEAAAKIAGVAKVLLADAPQLADGRAENVAEQVLALASSYSHILAPASAYGKTILPRVAARLDAAQISEITRIVSPDTFERPIYAGNAIATVQSGDRVKPITVRTTAFDAAALNGSAQVESIAPVGATCKSSFLSREMAMSDRPELSTAKIIVSGGLGMGSVEGFKMLESLADKLGAAIGASQAAVDAGFAPTDWQVGQSGKVVAPQLYIAVGISGSSQHLAGMKDAKTIVAINRDPEAPIFQVADYGIVGDLFEIVPQMIISLS